MPSSRDYPVAGVRIVADTSAYDQAIARVLADAAKLDAAMPTVKINVDDSEISSIGRLLEGVAEDQAVKITVADSQLRTAVDVIADIDAAAPDVKVTAEAADLQGVVDTLEQIRNLAVINLVMNIPSQVTDFITSNPLAQALVDTDSAVQNLRGRTMRDIPNAANIINDFYTNAWGDSRQQIVDLIVEMENAGIALDDIATVGQSVFEAATVAGADPIEMFLRMNSLVGNNLVNSYGEAGDAIAFFTKSGLNRGRDLLDTISEYSQVANSTGLSIGAMFEILDSGIGAGARDTDKLIDSYKEMLSLSREEVANFVAFGTPTARTGALEEIGMLDAAEAYAQGQITADEYAAGVLAGIQSAEDEMTRLRLVEAIFSPTMVEDAGIPALLATDLTDSDTLSLAWQGTAEEGATTMNDTLSTSIEEVARTIETAIMDALDNAFDLTARLDTFKAQLTGFADALQAGLGLGEALEVSFGIEGADDFVTRFESAMGNVLIAILELVAGIRDLQGVGSEGIRGEIARLSAQQLVFDLQAVTGEEMGGVLRTGIDRGVNEKQMQVALSTAVAEAIESGNLEQAEAIVAAAEAINGLRIDMGGGLFEETVRVVSVSTGGLQEQIDAEVARQAIEVPVRPTFERTEDRDDFSDVTADIASFTAGQAASAADVANAAAAVSFADAFIAAADATAMASSDTVGSMVGIEEAAIAMGDTVTEVIQGNTVIDDFDLMAASAQATAPLVTGAVGGMEQSFVSLGSVATNEMDRIIGKLMELQSGFSTFFGDMGNLSNLSNIITNSTTTVNANIVNNNASNAQAVSANQQTASAIRGVTP